MRCKSSIVSCAPAGPMTQTTFSASLARSYPRGASPEAVSFPAAAIQLSARIALLRRAKARWFRERGFPGSVFPIQSRGDSVRLPARRQSAPGGWGRWPIQICSRTDRIRYDSAASSAAFFAFFFSDFCSRRAASAAFLRSFFACACIADWRSYSAWNSAVRSSGKLLTA